MSVGGDLAPVLPRCSFRFDTEYVIRLIKEIFEHMTVDFILDCVLPRSWKLIKLMVLRRLGVVALPVSVMLRKTLISVSLEKAGYRC